MPHRRRPEDARTRGRRLVTVSVDDGHEPRQCEASKCAAAVGAASGSGCPGRQSNWAFTDSALDSGGVVPRSERVRAVYHRVGVEQYVAVLGSPVLHEPAYPSPLDQSRPV